MGWFRPAWRTFSGWPRWAQVLTGIVIVVGHWGGCERREQEPICDYDQQPCPGLDHAQCDRHQHSWRAGLLFVWSFAPNHESRVRVPLAAHGREDAQLPAARCGHLPYRRRTVLDQRHRWSAASESGWMDVKPI